MEVSLSDILAAREQRVQRQRALLEAYSTPLVCFTMNIAGPEKCSPLIHKGFLLGHEQLLAHFRPVHHETYIADTGCEGYYCIDSDPLPLKQAVCQIEDNTPAGRLFDMDVLLPDGQKVSRDTIGLPERKCLICGGPARICGRSRAHSVECLQAETTRLLQEALWQQESRRIGSLAVQSLLWEVATTPKPGLVDRANNGSHRDMDFYSFTASATALEPYFTRCAYIGMETANLPAAETFARLRTEGIAAEATMYRTTGGVNTHKGAIFTLGLLCGAAGRRVDHITGEVMSMVQGLSDRDFAQLTEKTASTIGEKLYVRYGITGIRGQAEQGFPAVTQVGLPVLQQGLAQGLSLNDAGCAALLHILSATVDTNLIARSDVATQQKTAADIAALLRETPYPDRQTLRRLDQAFIQKNLSPGGSADLLAATYFVHSLNH